MYIFVLQYNDLMLLLGQIVKKLQDDVTKLQSEMATMVSLALLA